jgi:Ca2+-binding EF-hand superfamily protein
MEITPFLDGKLGHRFRTHDADGDGFIQRSDFEESAARLGAEFGHEPDSPTLQSLMRLSVQLWDKLATADTDHDGRISEAEFKAAFAAALLDEPGALEQGYLPYVEAILRIADADGDGRLTVDDQVRWTRALMRLPEEHVRDGFRQTDTDGDGYITTGEVLDGVRGYYFDLDPGSAAAWTLDLPQISPGR